VSGNRFARLGMPRSLIDHDVGDEASRRFAAAHQGARPPSSSAPGALPSGAYRSCTTGQDSNCPLAQP
jgi:hypothetical protein